MPTALGPHDGETFPDFNDDVRAQLSAAGWDAFGVMCPIVAENGKLVMLQHRETAKTAEGQLGPLGETIKRGECVGAVIRRALQEELGLDADMVREINLPKTNGWVMTHWQNYYRGESEPRNCLALATPLFISQRLLEHLVENPPKTVEIDGIQLHSASEVMALPDDQLRFSTKSWLSVQRASSLLVAANHELTPLPTARLRLALVGAADDDLR